MKINRNKRFSYGKILLGIFSLAIFIFLVVPSIISVPMSFSDTSYISFPPKGFTLKWHNKFFTDEKWIEPTILSLKLASITTIVSLVIGTMASLAMVRGKLVGKRLLHIFFISPMMIPHIVTAFALYGLFAKLHFIGKLHGLVLAHTIICVPYVILVVGANLYRFDQSLELAARNLGASAIKAFFYVTLPIIRPGIIAAGIFCFISSLDELVLVLFLMGTSKFTLPLRMFSNIQFVITPVVAAASTVFIVAAIGTIIAMSFIRRKEEKLGA